MRWSTLKVAAIVVVLPTIVLAADWSRWEIENSVAQERDWLVVRQPGEGFCYVKQSYDSDPSKMEMMVRRDGAPAIVTPYYRGISGDVTYQVDDDEVGKIRADTIGDASAIHLPAGLVPALKAGKQLIVRLRPTGQPVVTQTFGLHGFTAAMRWLDRDVCRVGGTSPATGNDGTTALDARLERAAGGKIRVIGETALPNGMRLMIGLRNPAANYFAQDKVEVSGGAFESTGFSNRGEALPSGAYEVSISSPIPRLQPTSVRSAIGENGERLSGPAVVEEDGKRRISWTVRRDLE